MSGPTTDRQCHEVSSRWNALQESGKGKTGGTEHEVGSSLHGARVTRCGLRLGVVVGAGARAGGSSSLGSSGSSRAAGRFRRLADVGCELDGMLVICVFVLFQWCKLTALPEAEAEASLRKLETAERLADAPASDAAATPEWVPFVGMGITPEPPGK